MNPPVALVLLALLFHLPATATESPGLELIMSDPDWIGPPPEDAFWSDDQQWIHFRQKRPGEDFRDNFRVAIAGGAAEELPAGAASSSAASAGMP